MDLLNHIQTHCEYIDDKADDTKYFILHVNTSRVHGETSRIV